MRRASRRDANHNRIVETVRSLGGEVVDLTDSENAGFDMLIAFNGHLFVTEVKDGSKPHSARRLTQNEQRRCAALANVGVPYHVIESDDDVLRLRERALRIQ